MRPRAKDILAAGPLAGIAAGSGTLVLRPRSVTESAVALLLWILLGFGVGGVTALIWSGLRRSARVVSRGRPRRRLRLLLATLLVASLLVPLARAVSGPDAVVRVAAILATGPAAMLLILGIRLAFRRLTGISWTGVWAAAGLGVLLWLVGTGPMDPAALRHTALLFVLGTALLVVLRVNHAHLEPPVRRVGLGLGVSALAAALLALVVGGSTLATGTEEISPGSDGATGTVLDWALD